MVIICFPARYVNTWLHVLYNITRGRGLGPGPYPFQNQITTQLKYINPLLSNKEQAWVYWLADYFIGVGYGGGPGFKPADSQQYFLHITKLIKNEETRVSTQLVNNRPMQICHVIKMPHHHDGTALHVAVRTVRTGTVSTPILTCLTWR